MADQPTAPVAPPAPFAPDDRLRAALRYLACGGCGAPAPAGGHPAACEDSDGFTARCAACAQLPF